MSKIIHFPDKKEEICTASDFLSDCAQTMKDEGVTSILIAGKNDQGQVITGYYNCGFALKHELCGHIQCDVVDQMIRANPDRYD